MDEIEVFAEIDAPASVVWDVLLEFDSYPEWNPFVRSIEGVPLEGERLQVRLEPPDSRAVTFSPEVVLVEENRRLVWRGRLLVPFAFDGYHEFLLRPIDGGKRTRLLQRETFRGALVPLLLNEERIARGFREMNEAIKRRAEARATANADANAAA
ncbi:SRPBCC family protein [Natrialbaceae archaeon GCM10025810]|uniref:SRPBCC family protein n=1 Tax=Halovalidus salilacus TaxID=3075124 RepID=UPI003612D194